MRFCVCVLPIFFVFCTHLWLKSQQQLLVPVLLNRSRGWFLKGVGGTKIQKGELKAVRALQMIRELFQKKLETEPDAAAAVDQEQLSAVAGSQSDTGFLQPLAKKRKRPQAGADSEDWVNCQEEAGCAKAKAKARVQGKELFSAWDGPWLNNRLLPCHTCQEHGRGSDSDESHDHGPHADPEGKYRDTCKHMCPLCNTGEGAGKDVDMTSI